MTPTVLISYSARSAEDRKWRDRFLPQLEVLENAGLLDLWNEDRVDESGEWWSRMQAAADRAAVVVCLISPDYLASKFCTMEEIPWLLQRRQESGVVLLPVVVRHCPWKYHKWLDSIWLLPPDARDGKTVADYPDPDKPLSEAAEYIAKIVSGDLGRESAVSFSLETAQENIADTPQPVHRGEAGISKGLEKLHPGWIEITRLPQTGAELFGRASELALLDDAWASGGPGPSDFGKPDGSRGKTNLLAFVAWGGVGKSTLVNKWLERMAGDDYRGAERVFGWTFYSQGSGERVASADEFIASALARFGDEDPNAGTPWDKGERLAALIRQKRTLLILDGIEPLQSAAGFDRGRVTDPALATLLEELARDNPGLCIVTTRQRLAMPNDVSETMRQHDLELLTPDAGRALLRVAGVQGTDAELAASSAALGNHALAVTLLAAYLRDVPGHPATATWQILDLPDVAEAEGKHPRRLVAAFAARYGDGPEVELLRVLGLFDRPAPGGALAAVRAAPPIPGLTEHLSALSEADWLRLLERLRDDRLIARADRHAPDEVDAHPLVREHFAAILQAENPLAYREGHSRLYDFYRGQAPDLPDTLSEMTPLFVAVAHGCKAGRQQEALNVYNRRMQRDSKFYLSHQLGGYASELAVLAGFFDGTWDAPAPELSGEMLAAILNQVGLDLRALGRTAEAEEPLRAALELLVAHKSWRNAAVGAANVSRLALARGNVHGAITRGEEAIAYADSSQDFKLSIVARTTVADAKAQAGEADAARQEFEEAERIQTSHPRIQVFAGLPGYRYCSLLLDDGKYADVLGRAQQWLAVVGRSNYPLENALNHLLLGRAHAGLGDRSTARSELDAAVNGLRTASRQDHLPLGLLARAALRREMKDYPGARRDLDEVTRIAVRSGFRLHEADARLEWARIHLAEGDREQARDALARGKAIIAETGYHRRDTAVRELEAALAVHE